MSRKIKVSNQLPWKIVNRLNNDLMAAYANVLGSGSEIFSFYCSHMITINFKLRLIFNAFLWQMDKSASVWNYIIQFHCLSIAIWKWSRVCLRAILKTLRISVLKCLWTRYNWFYWISKAAFLIWRLLFLCFEDSVRSALINLHS